MRKDYVPIDGSGSLDESGFVEQYWTSQWQDRKQPPDVSKVGSHEEYLAMRPYLARMPKGSRLLDGGCGLGEWTLFLSGQGFDVVGLDISEATIGKLQGWFPGSQFEHGDLRKTRFAAGSFDGCFAWGTIEHFEIGLGPCLEEAHRLIRPGGWLFVTVPFHNGRLIRGDAGPLESWDRTFDPAVGYPHPQRFYQWRFTRPELARELELHGFRVDRLLAMHKGTGVGRWLRARRHAPAKGSLTYRATVRLARTILPASYVAHMVFAAAQRR